MPKINIFPLLFLLLLSLLLQSALYGINNLSVMDPHGAYGSKPGYIDEAVLVVEPHGSHVEQSLYLRYSDHYQYPGAKQLEVVHRFELPLESVINDLWLWIGDSVMQAVMMDTWTARAIYDSIVAAKRDPAFLSKTGNQYELHVYPLESGSYRKVKINFVAPTRWTGMEASVDLPLALLKSNNAAIKPLKILFRTQQAIWGKPSLNGLPEIPFTVKPDTLDYQFQYAYIADISKLNKLVLNYQTEFIDGTFYRANQKTKEPIYFQVGIHPPTYFNTQRDSSGKKVLIAVDLGGHVPMLVDPLINRIKKVMNKALSPNDEFRLLVAAIGQLYEFTAGWLPVTNQTIDTTLAAFGKSEMRSNLEQTRKKRVLFTDNHAATCWGFNGIDQIADVEKMFDLKSSLPYINSNGYDVVASYDHGYERALSTADLQRVLPTLDSLFLRGGRFLGFFDYNRVGRDLLGMHYIPGLTTRTQKQGMLYRNESGHIGSHFPESIYQYVINLLEYYPNEEVKIELQDSQGRPAVISKKIANGLLVISGIWAFREDDASRALLGVPLLGLHQAFLSKYYPQQLLPLLNECQRLHSLQTYDKLLLFSNADSLIPKNNAAALAENIVAAFMPHRPLIHTINLLDGSFPVTYLTDGGVKYYGSGYFQKAISDLTEGMHFETTTYDWDYITDLLNYAKPPNCKNMQVEAQADEGAGQLLELRQLAAPINDPDRPWFFIGAIDGQRSLHLNVSAEFVGLGQAMAKQFTVAVRHDTTQRGQIISSMLAYERLKDLFKQTPLDTAAIVDLAMKFRLLCDFTALIALEPSKKYRFMKNPFDESKMVPVRQHPEEPADSLRLDLYPNPFNDYLTMEVSGLKGAELTLSVYNLQGRLVRTLAVAQPLVGVKRFSWDGQDDAGKRVASGIYFVRAMLQQKGTPTVVRCKRVLLLR